MSNPEVSPLSDAQARAYPDWYKQTESLDDAVQAQVVAAKIAAVLADPANQVLLDTLYEGSSFTPTIGGAIGFEVVDNPEDPSKNESLDPVRAGIKALKDARAIKYESHIITDTETAQSAGGAVTEYEIDKWLIRVIPIPEEIQKFLPDGSDHS